MTKKEESANGAQSAVYIHALELQVETFALLASRLASLLHPGRDGYTSEMPSMRGNSRSRGKAVAKMEVASSSSSSKAPTGKSGSRKASKTRARKVVPSAKKHKTAKQMAKQKVYQARHYAKKHGFPIPELPTQEKVA